MVAAQEFTAQSDLEFLVPTPHAVYTSKPHGLFTLFEAATADIATAPIEEWNPDATPAMKAQMITDGLDDSKALSALREAIAQSGAEAEVVFSAPGLIEVTAAGANKGAMLTRLRTHLGVAPQAVVAFGDNYNDVPLLKTAGVGYAVGDAVGELRDVATDVIGYVIGYVEEEAEAAKLSELFSVA